MSVFFLFGCLGGGNDSEIANAGGLANLIGVLTGGTLGGSNLAPMHASLSTSYEDAIVTLYNTNNTYTNIASSNGEFSFRDIVAGNYVVIVNPGTGDTILFPIKVSNGEIITANLDVSKDREPDKQLKLTVAKAVYGQTTANVYEKEMPNPGTLEVIVNEDSNEVSTAGLAFASGYEFPATASKTLAINTNTKGELFDSLITGLPTDAQKKIQNKTKFKEMLDNPTESTYEKPTVSIIQYYNSSEKPNIIVEGNSLTVEFSAIPSDTATISSYILSLVDKKDGRVISSGKTTVAGNNLLAAITDATNQYRYTNLATSIAPGNYILTVTAIDSYDNAASASTSISVTPTNFTTAKLIATISPGNLMATTPINVGTLTTDPEAPTINYIKDTNNGTTFEIGDIVKVNITFAGQTSTITFPSALTENNISSFTLTIGAKYYVNESYKYKSSSTTFSYDGNVIIPNDFITLTNQDGLSKTSFLATYEVGDTITTTVSALNSSDLINKFKLILSKKNSAYNFVLTESGTTETHDWATNSNYYLTDDRTSTGNSLLTEETNISSANSYFLTAKFSLNSGLIKYETREIKVYKYPPKIISVTSLPKTVIITFDQKVDKTLAETKTNYIISPPLTVLNASLQANKRIVVLSTADQNGETDYTLTVSNIADLKGNAMSSSSKTFSGIEGIAVASATPISNTSIKVIYSIEPHHENDGSSDDALTLDNYSISGLDITNIALDSEDTTNKTYILTTSSQSAQSYTLQVSNVADKSTSQAIAQAAGQAIFTGDALPTVSSVEISPVPVQSGDILYLKNTDYTFTITFNETMNTEITPTITLGGKEITQSSYSGNTWIGTIIAANLPANGSQTLSISNAKDSTGNEMAMDTSYSYTIDKAPPASPSIYSPANPLTTKETTVDIIGSKEANTAIYLNGSSICDLNAETTWNYSATGLSEGENILSFSAVDLAGNFSSATTLTVNVDTTPPATPTHLNFLQVAASTANLSFVNPTDTDLSQLLIYVQNSVNVPNPAITVADLTINNPTPGAYTPVLIKNLDEILYSVFIFSKDTSGNITSSPASVNINIDNTDLPNPGSNSLKGTILYPGGVVNDDTYISVFNNNDSVLYGFTLLNNGDKTYNVELSNYASSQKINIYVNGIPTTTPSLPYSYGSGIVNQDIVINPTKGVDALQVIDKQ